MMELDESDADDLYKEMYKQELEKAANRELKRKVKHGVTYGLINGLPTGFLPYRAQKWIKNKVDAFSPKIASIASAAYLGALGAYIFNLPTMEFSRVSTGSFFVWRFYSVIYDITIPSIVFKSIGGYLMADTLRAPISYFKRPHGTLAAEAVGYIKKGINRLISASPKVQKIAKKNAKKLVEVIDTLDAEELKRNRLNYLNELQSGLYNTMKNYPDSDSEPIKTEINKLRKKMGLEEII